MPSALYLVAGSLCLALIAIDVFLTVLHHWGGGGPLARYLSRAVWWIAGRLRYLAPPRHRRLLLGLAGPLIIPITLVAWGALTILGFALLYLPLLPGAFSAARAVPYPTSFGDALYFSGVSFFTLGYGDVVPTGAWTRFLGIAQAGSGFALITLAISYFSSVYTAFSGQRRLAESIHAQQGPHGPAGLLARQYTSGGSDAVGHALATLREGLAAAHSAYNDYPILLYFISPRPRESLLRLLYVAREASLLLEVAVDAREVPELHDLGRRIGLEDVATSVQTMLVRTQSVSVEEQEEMSGDHGMERGFHHSRAVLRDAGIAVREDGEAYVRYARERSRWEGELRACAARVGEEEWRGILEGS